MESEKKEIWKAVNGYEGFYEVSSIGRVRSVPRTIISSGFPRKRQSKMLAASDYGGYCKVTLQKDGSRKTKLVHQLVAAAFIENPNNYKTINHIDENPKNNSVENLEWCTQKYNINYGSRTERMKITKGHPVFQYDANMNLICEYVSQASAAKENGFSQPKICSACNTPGRRYKGFYWSNTKL